MLANLTSLPPLSSAAPSLHHSEFPPVPQILHAVLDWTLWAGAGAGKQGLALRKLMVGRGCGRVSRQFRGWGMHGLSKHLRGVTNRGGGDHAGEGLQRSAETATATLVLWFDKVLASTTKGPELLPPKCSPFTGPGFEG